MEFKHIPVLLNEVIDNLNIKKDGIYIDGTLGGAGHSIQILSRLKNGILIGIDKDQKALDVSRTRLEEILEKTNNSKIILIRNNYENINEILEEININKVDGILLDLGVSSYQLDTADRGFSYNEDGPLDMRMDQSSDLTAEYIVNNYSEEELANIIYKYGEEKYSRKIAERIIEKRKEKTIRTTKELVEIIESVIPFKKSEGNRAKRTFQALRIETNSELKNLEQTIEDSINQLKENGRLLIITFHSLEDRIVKQKFIELEGKCNCPKDLPYCVCNPISYGKIITKKPIIPKEEELIINKRSHSAKLRIFEKG